MARQIRAFAPGDVGGLRATSCAASEADLPGRVRAAGARAVRVPGATCCALLPDLLRLRELPQHLRRSSRSFVKNPRLRFALSFHPLFVGGNPFTTTSIYGLIAFLERRWGVHFAIGGTGQHRRRAWSS